MVINRYIKVAPVSQTIQNKREQFVEKQLDYDSVSNKLSQQGVIVDAAEVHGILCGMLCGGMSLTDQKWLEALSETINQGDAFSDPTQHLLNSLFNQTCQQLLEPEFALNLLLPDDQAPINDRGAALINWVQGFMLGFGLHQQDLMQCSDDVKEALEDFSDISRMEEPMDADEESEKALLEVEEYVKISAILCFSELGQSLLDDQQDTPSVH
ncbi:putative conserved exported protein precursor [Alteromonas macleodii]|jgi:yecA family protein|tara:strand:+ start:123 stop:758 length:636 start_codon:yes stop_codon:yes gene_type:complete